VKQSPIFARTYDFVQWLIPRTMSFPREQRFVLTKRIQDAALDFQDRIIEAAVANDKLRTDRLVQADMSLAKLRFYLRLARDLEWLSLGQYEHVARMVEEIGRLLGGWTKKEAARQRDPSQAAC
jgi:four helix bundle protein